MEPQRYRWDAFLAHAGSDIAAAEELYDRLKDHCKVFLDSRCILLGDDWDQELALAQRESLLTVVLVSRSTEQAYYQREEIAAAIDMARKDKDRHRVVPVFLDAQAEEIITPYGLRLKHSLYLSKANGLAEIAQSLLLLLSQLKQRGSLSRTESRDNPSLTPKATATINLPDNPGSKFARVSLQKLIDDARTRSRFPKQVLNIYPAPLKEGLRWESPENGGWSFQVNFDGSVEYQIMIAEGATFMERDQSGFSKLDKPKPGLSAFHCLWVPIGVVSFWGQLMKEQEAKGDLEIVIDDTLGRFLSFDGLDKNMNPDYPDSWRYTHWNHDARQCRVNQIQVTRGISSNVTSEELISLAADVFTEIGFYFGFRVENSMQHPLKVIRDLAAQLAQQPAHA